MAVQDDKRESEVREIVGLRAGETMDSLLTLGPDDMESWISKIDRYMKPDFQISEHVARGLELEDMHIICGEKSIYGRKDAKALHKKQWSDDRYLSEMDMENGYSPSKMLEILRLRAQYLTARGATLNNPHIPKSFLSKFQDRKISAKTPTDELRKMTQAAIREVTLASEALSQVATQPVVPFGLK